MQGIQKFVLRGASGLIVGILCCIWWQGPGTNTLRASTLQKSFTSHHILDKTVALLPIIGSLAVTSTYSAEYCTVHKRDGAPRHIWMIDCANSANEGIGHCTWDADTGQLIEVKCPYPVTPSRNNPLNSRSAINSTKIWLLELGLQTQTDSWHPTLTPEHKNERWTVKFRSKNQTLDVMVDDEGNLLALQNW